MNPMRIFVGLTLGMGVAGALAAASPALGAAMLAGVIGWAVWPSLTKRGRGGVSLRVHQDELVIETDADVEATRIPLGSIHNVEIESKAIQRVTYEQPVGAPLPSTRLSGDVDVARIAFVLDGGAAPVRLTEKYASYSHCTEWFGKVRVFLRSHGWVPEDERER